MSLDLSRIDAVNDQMGLVSSTFVYTPSSTRLTRVRHESMQTLQNDVGSYHFGDLELRKDQLP